MFKVYECWTDGSYKSSLNTGGWATIITKDQKIEKILHQGFINTTNNRCEIYAVLATLQYFNEPTKIKIYSDSQYVVNTINNRWFDQWFKNNDVSKKNLDLWKQISILLDKHDVQCIWVKGHSNNKMNSLADLYATHSAECLNLKEDDGTLNN